MQAKRPQPAQGGIVANPELLMWLTLSSLVPEGLLCVGHPSQVHLQILCIPGWHIVQKSLVSLASWQQFWQAQYLEGERRQVQCIRPHSGQDGVSSVWLPSAGW